MPLPKTYQSFAEFEREILRRGERLGMSLEEIVEDSFEAEFDVDDDPFSEMRDEY